MKKFLAILLAMMLVLVNVAALADDGDPTDANIVEEQQINASGVPTPVTEFTLTKNYNVSGTGAVNPADVITFTVSDPTRSKSSADFTTATATDEQKAAYTVVIPDVTVASGAGSANIIVKLPRYDLAGVYSYTITENNTNKAGVTYLADTLYLNVTVATDLTTDTNNLYIAGIAVHKTTEDGIKIDEFENKYDAGTLTVSKNVEGNLGDRTKYFTFTVEFEAGNGQDTVKDVVNGTITTTKPTFDSDEAKAAEVEKGYVELTDILPADWSEGKVSRTFTLKHGQEVSFANIPSGVTYKVTETAFSDYETTINNKASTDLIATDTISAEKADAEAKYINTKEDTPDTGIELETLPFVLLMGIALVGVMALRRREDY